jgi:hypothetical protein
MRWIALLAAGRAFDDACSHLERQRSATLPRARAQQLSIDCVGRQRPTASTASDSSPMTDSLGDIVVSSGAVGWGA